MQNKRPIRILLIEDNPGDVRLTQEAFSECQRAIVLNVVMDGVEAINYLYKAPPYENALLPDLILLDLNLPKMDGRQVLEKVKKDDRLKLIPIIMLTTSNAAQDVLDTYGANVNAYLNKPVDFDQFFDIIQKIEEFWLNTAVLPTMP